MMDDNDDGARVGLWVVLGIVTLLLFGLIGGLAMRASHHKAAAVQAVAKTVPAVQAGEPDALAMIDAPLTGEIVGKLFFESASFALPAEGGAGLDAAIKAIADNPAKKLVIAGFHDPSGDAAKNAELAKQRAKAVRDALTSRGVPLDKVLLRKPEQTALGGPADEARRVEVRLVD